MPRPEVMRHMLAGENIGLITSRLTKGETYRHAQVTHLITEVICMSPKTSNNGFLFPLYLYPKSTEEERDLLDAVEEGAERRPNLAPEFIEDCSKRLKLSFISDGVGDLKKTFGPEDGFHYMYAVFHLSLIHI